MPHALLRILRSDASCSTERVWYPGAVPTVVPCLYLCSSQHLHSSAACLLCAQGMVGRRPRTQEELYNVTEGWRCWPCRRSRRWRRRAPGAWGAVLGGGLGMRRAETAPAELPLEALTKGASSAVHALDLAAPTRMGAGAGSTAGERKPGHAGGAFAAANGLASARAEDKHGAGGAGSSTSGRSDNGRLAGVDANGGNTDDTAQGARAAGFGRAPAGSEAGGRMRGKAPVVADRSRLGGEGGGNGTPSGPGPPGV